MGEYLNSTRQRNWNLNRKPTSKDYGRRHYVSDDDYQTAMRRVPDKAVYNKNILKQSEFKKPYRLDSETYEEMEYHYGDPSIPDYLPPQPNADVEGEIPGLYDYGLVHCFGDLCYCKGQTKCFDWWCTYPLIKAWFDDPNMGVSFSGNQICISAPATGVFGSQTLWYDLQLLKRGKKTSISHLYKDVSECDPSECCGCTGISIGYTTQQMSVSTQQTLTVVGAVEGCTYDWAIASGGGSLSANTGTSVVYTAPATNPECALNPTITLSVGSTQCSSLYISVTAGTTVAGYFASNDIVLEHGVEQCCLRVTGICTYQVRAVNYYCDGTYGYTLRNCSPGHQIECEVAQYYAWCSTECAIERANCDLGECSDGCAAGLHDTRTAAQKTAGCCPLELM